MDSYEQERDRNEDLQEELIHLDRGERRARRWRTAYMTISLALAPFAGAGLVDAARFLGVL